MKKKKKKKPVDLDSLRNPFAAFQGVAAKWKDSKNYHKKYIGIVLQGVYGQFSLLSEDDQEELLKAYSVYFLKEHGSVLKGVMPLLRGIIGGK